MLWELLSGNFGVVNTNNETRQTKVSDYKHLKRSVSCKYIKHDLDTFFLPDKFRLYTEGHLSDQLQFRLQGHTHTHT